HDWLHDFSISLDCQYDRPLFPAVGRACDQWYHLPLIGQAHAHREAAVRAEPDWLPLDANPRIRLGAAEHDQLGVDLELELSRRCQQSLNTHAIIGHRVAHRTAQTLLEELLQLRAGALR